VQTHPHITKQVKTITIQETHQMKYSQYPQYKVKLRFGSERREVFLCSAQNGSSYHQ